MGKVSKALNKSQSQYTPDFIPSDHVSGTIDQKDQPVTRAIKEKPLSVKTTVGPKPKDVNTEKWDERLILSTRYVTGVAEGIRKLRTRIVRAESDSKIKSIMILSSDPQEGKSFVCANLGFSFAKSLEYQVVLVDCDLRRPSMHTMFGLNGKEGLSDYLNGQKKVSNISELEVDSGLPKLSIIPAGSPPNNPAELLSSAKLSEMVDELSSRHHDRLVILDTPPFHTAAETLLLSELVDKIVLVVRWGKSGRENIKKMVDTIGREKILGTVFNAFEMSILDRKIQGVGYGNYYSEYY